MANSLKISRILQTALSECFILGGGSFLKKIYFISYCRKALLGQKTEARCQIDTDMNVHIFTTPKQEQSQAKNQRGKCNQNGLSIKCLF